MKIKEKQKKIKEKEKKREARALIILAKLLLKTMDKERIRTFLDQHREHFIQKERNKSIDYSTYIYKILKEME
ncbi:MAG: hypothetical protein Q9M89_01640 [Persephonella sp.]|nr:hypothetical protein [Persephonella sp.]